METKVEEKNFTPYTPEDLSMDRGWEKQVNWHSAEAEEEGRRRRHEEAKMEAARIVEKRIRRTMSALALGIALIISGAIYLNYVDGFPTVVAAGITVAGSNLLSFVIGWIFGRKSR